MPTRVLIEGGPQAYASTPAQTSVGVVAAVVLVSNQKRKGFMVQNTGTTILKLAFGATPTQTVYHVSLKGGTVADDGTGSVYVDDVWVGDVSAVSSVAGGTCVITEFRTGSPDWNQASDWGL
jgi:hypothetical protein